MEAHGHALAEVYVGHGGDVADGHGRLCHPPKLLQRLSLYILWLHIQVNLRRSE